MLIPYKLVKLIEVDMSKTTQESLEENFDLKTLSDVGYHAMKVFSIQNDLVYLKGVYKELKPLKHWLLQLHWCYQKMDQQNWYLLCQALNYQPSDLAQAFKVISRKT